MRSLDEAFRDDGKRTLANGHLRGISSGPTWLPETQARNFYGAERRTQFLSEKSTKLLYASITERTDTHAVERSASSQCCSQHVDGSVALAINVDAQVWPSAEHVLEQRNRRLAVD
jgi:hypothetical protein